NPIGGPSIEDIWKAQYRAMKSGANVGYVPTSMVDLSAPPMDVNTVIESMSAMNVGIATKKKVEAVLNYKSKGEELKRRQAEEERQERFRQEQEELRQFQQQQEQEEQRERQ